jgi:hypothetical protein
LVLYSFFCQIIIQMVLVSFGSRYVHPTSFKKLSFRNTACTHDLRTSNAYMFSLCPSPSYWGRSSPYRRRRMRNGWRRTKNGWTDCLLLFLSYNSWYWHPALNDKKWSWSWTYPVTRLTFLCLLLILLSSSYQAKKFVSPSCDRVRTSTVTARLEVHTHTYIHILERHIVHTTDFHPLRLSGPFPWVSHILIWVTARRSVMKEEVVEFSIVTPPPV